MNCYVIAALVLGFEHCPTVGATSAIMHSERATPPNNNVNNSNNGGNYDSVYYPPVADHVPPWQYSPLFNGTQMPMNAAYFPGYYAPQAQDPWHYPPRPFKSYSMDRLNTTAVRVSPSLPAAYFHRSPNPSPVHTPSSSPVLNRARFSPGPVPRRIPVPIPAPIPAASCKPPRPRQRPPLQKAKTVDAGDCYAERRSCDDLRKICNDGSVLVQRPTPRMDSSTKMPSLDSLYEQLKAFAASPRVDAALAADLAALVGGAEAAAARTARLPPFSSPPTPRHFVKVYLVYV